MQESLAHEFEEEEAEAGTSDHADQHVVAGEVTNRSTQKRAHATDATALGVHDKEDFTADVIESKRNVAKDQNSKEGNCLREKELGNLPEPEDRRERDFHVFSPIAGSPVYIF